MSSEKTEGDKTRLPNKVIWGLEDIMALCIAARKEWGIAAARAERREMDPTMMMTLARLGQSLMRIEQKARDARRGEYRDDKTELPERGSSGS